MWIEMKLNHELISSWKKSCFQIFSRARLLQQKFRYTKMREIGGDISDSTKVIFLQFTDQMAKLRVNGGN